MSFFRNRGRILKVPLYVIKKNIKETILATSWSEEYLKANERELIILKRLELEKSMVTWWKKSSIDLQRSIPNVFSSPPTGFIKLNFDGESRGNLGLAGLGGIFRDSNSKALRVYTQSSWYTTNNVVELQVLE